MFELNIRLADGRRTVQVPASQRQRLLTEVLRAAGLPLNTRCGQRGLCNGCWVQLLGGALEVKEQGKLVGAAEELLRGCELRVPAEGNAEIHVPARSLLAHQPQVVTSFMLNVPRAHDPLWQSLSLRADEWDGKQSGRESLLEVVRARLDTDVPLIADERLDQLPFDAEGRCHVVLQHAGSHRLLCTGDVVEPAYGVAVDIGTTTVVVVLVELSTGTVVGSASALNAQTRLGDNVLTRINICMTQPHMIERMQTAVVRRTLMPLLTEAMQQANVAPQQLACMVVAGNTTMLHLLLGVDPSSLGTAPFTPVFLEHRIVSADELKLRLRRPEPAPVGADCIELEEEVAEADESSFVADAAEADTNEAAAVDGAKVTPPMSIHLLPGAAAYVGADITAGVLSSGMAYREETCLLVDLGTNGELVLRCSGSGGEGRFLGCATAAGPAFEGAGLTYGMRAGKGAIGHVWLETLLAPPRIEVIGGGTPSGLCGTAYIDFVARARRQGLITPTARFSSEEHPCLMRHETHGLSFVVAHSHQQQPLLITEADMACLLQAKAAIAAGVTCLLREAGLQPADVQTVYLAGGFGFHMHVDSLLGCGMLPGFRPEQVQLVGNTALGGAYLTLLDSGALREIRRISSQMKIIELNLAPDFESIYIDQLSLS